LCCRSSVRKASIISSNRTGAPRAVGRPEPWREVWHRLKRATTEEDAIEAAGDLRELLAEEDLLLPSGSA
jgi:hypothetical protein